MAWTTYTHTAGTSGSGSKSFTVKADKAYYGYSERSATLTFTASGDTSKTATCSFSLVYSGAPTLGGSNSFLTTKPTTVTASTTCVDVTDSSYTIILVTNAKYVTVEWEHDSHTSGTEYTFDLTDPYTTSTINTVNYTEDTAPTTGTLDAGYSDENETSASTASTVTIPLSSSSTAEYYKYGTYDMSVTIPFSSNSVTEAYYRVVKITAYDSTGSNTTTKWLVLKHAAGSSYLYVGDSASTTKTSYSFTIGASDTATKTVYVNSNTTWTVAAS